MDDNINEEIVGDLRFLIENGKCNNIRMEIQGETYSIEENQLVSKMRKKTRKITAMKLIFGDGEMVMARLTWLMMVVMLR